MVTFSFNSFGKVKLLISRLSKLTTNAQLSLFQDKCELTYGSSRIKTDVSIIEGVLPDEGECFMINLVNLHHIIKSIPATNKFICKWDHKTVLEICTKVQRMNNPCNNSIRLMVKPLEMRDTPIYCTNKFYYSSSKTSVDIHHLIWIMEKVCSNFEEVLLSFNGDKLRIAGSESEYEFESEIVLDNKIGDFSLKIDSVKFLQELWLLEWNNSCVCFFIEPNTLELYTISKSDNEEVLLMLR
jgi:hypothetical protein